jgi:hypothetical protein
MLIIVFILVCVSLAVSYQELGRPVFLEGIVGLTHVVLKFEALFQTFSVCTSLPCSRWILVAQKTVKYRK